MDNVATTLSPLVIDLIFAALILLVACIKAKIGFFQSVMKIVVIILALGIGFVGSKMLLEPASDFIWSKYGPIVEEKFDKKVDDAITGQTNAVDIFKEVWNDTITGFGTDKLDVLKIQDSDVDFNDSETVQRLKVFTLAKAKLLCDKVCHFGLFCIITAVALLVLTIIKNILGDLANFSIIGWANHLLGFVFGAVEMIVIMLVIIRGAGLLGIDFFTNLSEGTVLLKWLIGGNMAEAVDILKNLSFEDFKNIDLKQFTTIDFDKVGKQVEELVKNIDVPGAIEKVQEVIK